MIGALVDSYLCRYLTLEEAQRLLSCGEVKVYPRDSRIFSQGDPGGFMCVILVGQVKVVTLAPDEGEKVLALLVGGDIVGEMALVDAEPRSATAITVSDTTIFELSRKNLMDFMRKEPSIAARVLWAMMETVSARLREANRNYQDLLVRHTAILRKEPRPAQ